MAYTSKFTGEQIDASIEAVNAEWVTETKVVHSTNLYDKNTMTMESIFYINAHVQNGKMDYKTSGVTYGGIGVMNFPVEYDKDYVIHVGNLVTLTDMDNKVYGNITSLFFTDDDLNVISGINIKGEKYFASNSGDTSQAPLFENDDTKAIVKQYGSNSTKLGCQTVSVRIVSDKITKMHIQLGGITSDFGLYQINNTFGNRGRLTAEELQNISDGFQINAGTKLLEYEDFGSGEVIETYLQSTIKNIEDRFSMITIESTNLLLPSYIQNHKYVNATIPSTGIPNLSSGYGRCALLQVPVSAGDYILSLNGTTDIGNKTFGYLGCIFFLDSNGKLITHYTNDGTSYFTDKTLVPDATKATCSGYGTTRLDFSIFDKNISQIVVNLLDSDKNKAGLWTKYENDTGLTDEEVTSLILKGQLNLGKKIKKWQPYDYVEYRQCITPDYIYGLDEKLSVYDETIENVNTRLDNFATEMSEYNMILEVADNSMYCRCKQWKDNEDIVWVLAKEQGGNGFFNFYELSTTSKSSESMDSLTRWKSCSDDICPPNFNGFYIGANHGATCVDAITVTAHGKTEADIGSVWTNNNKTYCLIKIPDENTLWMVMFNDTNMANGKMSYGSPSGTMVHSSGATNTSDIVIESRTGTQLWRCQNNYNIETYCDDKLVDISTNFTQKCNKVNIMTTYNIIYIPAMLTYLMNNVGNNTNDSQYSDDITDSYCTMYINYEFRPNGSCSQQSSFYANKELTINYIGLVQSVTCGSSPYCYVPDTTYDTPVLQDGTTAQNFTKDVWNNQEKVPYRYYQFQNNTFDRGMALIYDNQIGWGENSKRLEHCSQAGMFWTSRKQYPAFIAGGTVAANTYFDGIAYRIPFYKYDEDLLALGWAYRNDDILLYIDSNTAIDKDIKLPDFMNHYRVEVVDKHDNCTFNQTYIFNKSIRYKSGNGVAWLVLRLYK